MIILFFPSHIINLMRGNINIDYPSYTVVIQLWHYGDSSLLFQINTTLRVLTHCTLDQNLPCFQPFM